LRQQDPYENGEERWQALGAVKELLKVPKTILF